MEKINIKMVAGARYMDDIRVWLHAIRLGWRIIDGELRFRREWLEEERKDNISPLQKTTRILEEIMNGICGWLNLTMETEDMFGGTLPTLDLQIWIRNDNKVLYKYYEKAMIPTTVIHARSAIPESARRATLNQELIRRLTNTSELVDDVVRVSIVDDYAQKLVNSEYTVKKTQEFIIGGLKGYERLLSLSRDTTNPRWKPLHLSASWNSRNRRLAKQLSKSSWYKGKTEVEPPTLSNLPGGSSNRKDDKRDKTGTENHASTGDKEAEKVFNSSEIENKERTLHRAGQEKEKRSKKKKRGGDRHNITLGGLKRVEVATKRKEKRKLNKKLGVNGFPTMRKRKRGQPLTTRSVMFLDNTANAELIRRMQKVEEDIGEKTNWRVRMTEAAGTPLSILLTSNNPWGEEDCQRDDCIPCSQGDERRMNCRRRNIMYESRCQECNKDEDAKSKKMGEIRCLRAGKGIYVGESSRSLYERSKEHRADRESMLEESHQVKHWLLHHQELHCPPAFRYKVIATFKDPMTRQLSEAVRIELRGSEVLNSKSEYSRCRVPRLRVDLEGWKQNQSKESSNQGEANQNEETEINLQGEGTNKRKKDQEEGGNMPSTTRRSKRRKLECLVGWGEGTSLQGGVENETLPEGWKDKVIESGEQNDKTMKQVTLPLGWRGSTSNKDSSSTGNQAPIGVAQHEPDNVDAEYHPTHLS